MVPGSGKRPIEGEEGQQGAKRSKGPAGAAVVPAEVVDLTVEEGGTAAAERQATAPSLDEGESRAWPWWSLVTCIMTQPVGILVASRVMVGRNASRRQW